MPDLCADKMFSVLRAKESVSRIYETCTVGTFEVERFCRSEDNCLGLMYSCYEVRPSTILRANIPISVRFWTIRERNCMRRTRAAGQIQTSYVSALLPFAIKIPHVKTFRDSIIVGHV
jgi:hypothetical protein